MADTGAQHDQFVRLLAANTGKLYAFVRMLVFNDANDAEEVFQSTCVALWNKFDQYDPSKDFGSWACRMAHYEVLRMREGRRRIKFLSDEALEKLAEAAIPVTQQLNERRAALAGCLEKLTREDFEIIHDRYFNELRPKEIAQQASRSAHSIYRDLNRVHGLLMRCIERELSGRSV